MLESLKASILHTIVRWYQKIGSISPREADGYLLKFRNYDFRKAASGRYQAKYMFLSVVRVEGDAESL